ncbi:MAG TPA: phosphoadenylyl-sulfate reductase [Rhizomicrobium sp.]|jgi:phosphoadenosine phosphosulfate reductase
MSAVTVIDRSRGPRAFDRPALGAVDATTTSRLIQLQDEVRGRDAEGVLRLALREAFTGRAAVVSSFGSESGVLLHMVARIDPATPVLFLNTGKLFGETLRYRDRLQDVLGLTDIRAIGPHPADRSARDPEGTLWARDTDACCNFRKVAPVRRALEGFAAQITGRKRFQTHARAEMEKVEFFEGRFRFNPLADWTQSQLEAYFTEHDIPRHPLVEDGYPSIGCMPCTRRVQSGESYRDGRWSGLDKDECGIHTGVDGEGI